ncbi:hypothetical protein [Streptomyces sp. GC420]|uniref:hypothetical protein n=1 Tax=Streptomyces sp. GC420 TaxID=2697568 RepID=UPI0028BE11BE|nr:hypothetical protein [Streptomyces sp. GC420]
MSARRPLITATAAGTLLCALWFVPSANATADKAETASRESSSQTSGQAEEAEEARAAAQDGRADRSERTTGQSTGTAGEDLTLADTGSVDTTPYLIGGTGLLGLGAGFVAYSMRVGSRSSYGR